MASPINPARSSPNIIRMAEEIPFFTAIPNMNPSARSSKMPTMPANVRTNKLKLTTPMLYIATRVKYSPQFRSMNKNHKLVEPFWDSPLQTSHVSIVV